MEAKKAKKNKVRGIKNAFIVIIICFIVALVVFTQVLGALKTLKVEILPEDIL